MAAISSSYKVKVASTPVSKKVAYRRSSVSFGDGYEQRTKTGINNIRSSWNIVFTDLNTTNKDALEGILNTAGGVDALDWVAPGAPASKKWLATEVNVNYYDGIFWEISCNLSELSEL